MNILSRYERIKFIKSFKQPPHVKDGTDNLWDKFGCMINDANPRWCWYRDEYIEASDHEVEVAYNEIKNFYEEASL